MEHALLVQKTGDKYVTIKQVKEGFGTDLARRQEYKCPSEHCGVKMITVFPQRLRRNGKETHSDHFRAKPRRHTPACTGDGQGTDLIDTATGDGTDVKPRHYLVRRSTFPMRYTKRSRAKRAVPDRVVIPEVEDLNPQEQKKRKASGIRIDIHTSRRETNHIRTIVESYEDPPERLYRMSLKLPGCPARNYAEAFVDAKYAIDEEGRARENYIYLAPYSEHLVYANNAISITLEPLAIDGKKLCVWVNHKLGPAINRDDLKSRLWRASSEKNATVYVFGRFRAFNNWKYSLEVEAFGDLWITFPDSPEMSRSVSIAQPYL